YGDLLDMYKKSRAEGFGAEVKRRIMIGTYVLSHGYYDAYYLQAQKLRRMIADDFRRCLSQCDLIAGPVAPTVAWKLGQGAEDPVQAYLADIFTLPASLAGLPGMSVPAGFGEGGMPVGLQLGGSRRPCRRARPAQGVPRRRGPHEAARLLGRPHGAARAGRRLIPPRRRTPHGRRRRYLAPEHRRV
ncbi:MAG: amidase family protein, partial [Chloroflexota bacterium]